MSFEGVEAGKVVWLSGPSSSGKTTATSDLEKKGWMRIEADVEAAHVEVNELKKKLFVNFSFVESHITDPTTSNILDVVYGNKKPSIQPKNPEQFEKTRLELLNFLKSRNTENNQALLIHMLDKAVDLASLGKNVILDHVPFINDPELSSHHVVIDAHSKNLWCYRDFKIEQQLKYVPAETLMRNVIRRNHNPEDWRQMPMVLEQYSQRFTALTRPNEEPIGTLNVEHFKKWIERGVKINFFDINPNHGFKYDGSADIDQAIQTRLDQFVEEMKDPDHAIDPKGEKVDAENIEQLKSKSEEYPLLQTKIDEFTKSILQNMGIPEDASEVNLTYTSSSGIQATIIRDPSSS